MKDEGQSINAQNGNDVVPYAEGDMGVRYDDYEEINDFGHQTVDMIQQVTLAQDKLNTGLTLAQNIGGMYNECMQLHEHRKEVEAMSKVELANTVAKYKIAQEYITQSFAERNGALQQDYKVLDDAIARGDREMIIAAMGKIGDIVTTSPLAELQELCKRFDAPEDSLIDW